MSNSQSVSFTLYRSSSFLTPTMIVWRHLLDSPVHLLNVEEGHVAVATVDRFLLITFEVPFTSNFYPNSNPYFNPKPNYPQSHPE